MSTLSAVIIARNERDMIEGCLKRLDFVDEIVVVIDSRTTDDTAAIAHKYTKHVSTVDFTTFAAMKNHAIDQAMSDWILIIDADERISRKLAAEITELVKSVTEDDRASLAFDNYFFGRRMDHGGWQERHVRLFRRGTARYTGDIHEVLVFSGDRPARELQAHIAHFSHRAVRDSLVKTANYADVQAREMLNNGHPPVTRRFLLGVIRREFVRRFIRLEGYRDGMPGFIECIYQPFSLFSVYVRLWELQQTPSLPERYHNLETAIDD